MATQAEADAHRAAVGDITTLAVADLAAEWPSLPADDPLALANPLADILAALIGDYGDMAAAFAADFYEEMRDAAGVAGGYAADLADPWSDEQVNASASWASSAAWVDEQKALADAATVLDRAVAIQDRGTIELNVGRDPARPRFARYASANACAFCALNATRGPVFRSEAAAATKYHDLCRCIAVPVWTPSDYHEAPYVADWREAYYAATKSLGGATDPKAVLAHMRRGAGLR